MILIMKERYWKLDTLTELLYDLKLKTRSGIFILLYSQKSCGIR